MKKYLLILIGVISGLFCTIGYSKTDDIATNQCQSDKQDLTNNIKMIQNHEQSKSSLKTDHINDEKNKIDSKKTFSNIIKENSICFYNRDDAVFDCYYFNTYD